MKSKYLLLLIHLICLLFSCIDPSVDDEDSINVTYQIQVVGPDSSIIYPNLSIRDLLERNKDLALWLTTELYEINGSKENLIGRYDEIFDVDAQTLNSYTLKSNADYLLLYFLEIKRSHESFYEFDNLTNVKLRGQNNTINVEPNKEIFVGRMELKGGFKDCCDTIILESPFSFYQLQAKDLDAFIEKHADSLFDSIDINVRYLSFFPYAFDVFEMRPSKSERGYNYTRRVAVKKDAEGYLELGYDFLFMGEERAIASICVTATDPYSLKILSQVNVGFDYFLRRRKLVQGNFLTGKQNGITIDTTFQDDIIIEF